jgi:hypothetical protein
MNSKHSKPPDKMKFKTQPTEGKVMLILFWDSQGPVLEHYEEQGVTINSTYYCEILHDKMVVMWTKC